MRRPANLPSYVGVARSILLLVCSGLRSIHLGNPNGNVFVKNATRNFRSSLPKRPLLYSSASFETSMLRTKMSNKKKSNLWIRILVAYAIVGFGGYVMVLARIVTHTWNWVATLGTIL